MSSPTITIVGGGSVQWTFGLVRQFAASEPLAGSCVRLVDIDADALAVVGRACMRFNDDSARPIRIETTTDLAGALDGADFVLVAISTGGLDAMRHDLDPGPRGISRPQHREWAPGPVARGLRRVVSGG